MYPAKLLQNDPPAWQKLTPVTWSGLWLCYCAQLKQLQLLSAILAQVPRCLGRDGTFDLEQEVQRRDGASQSIHPTGLTGGHCPTHLGPTPQPQVQHWFPKQEEAQLGSHSTYSLSQEGGPISTTPPTEGCCLYLWRIFPFSKFHS